LGDAVILLDRWLSAARIVSRWAARCAGAAIFVSAAVVSVDVLGRKFLSLSVGGADEISGYAFAIATSWALAFVLLERANVRVDALYIHLPKPVMALLDLVALLMLGLFVLLLGWFAGRVLEDSLLFATKANTPLGTPQWIPQSLWLAGFGLFAFAWLPLVLRVALALLAGDVAQIRALAGARTLEEDAAAEVAHTTDIEKVAIEGRR
jgi:TRAP-type mannitol/chloroaromatic compound transport system permease small subunit